MKRGLNNKGFTLVELLATVVILLAISTVAITSISASIDRQNQKKDDATKELIVSYGRLYLEEHINDTYSGYPCVSVATLKSTYNLNEDTLKQSNGTLFGGSVRTNDNYKTFEYRENGC